MSDEELGGRTAWARNLAAPVRDFLATETGSAVALLGATVLALAWANADPGSYGSVWGAQLSVRLAGAGVAMDLRHWVDQGLMALFFLVVGLEARRELDVGELRARRRLAIPMLAALGGMVVPIGIYLAWNAGGHGAGGWGAAMSSDTAFALGALALITPRAATRLRVFLLTVAVFDDLGALVVIATAYTHHVDVVAFVAAIGLFTAFLVAMRAPLPGRRQVRIGLELATWVAMRKSGIDPVIVGLAVGLATDARPPGREQLEQATALTRSFREQPTPELARSARLGVMRAVSPNERLQYGLHPWVGYVIVPLFALANAGVHVTGGLLSAAVTAPVTLGIVTAYVIGKPIGILGAAWLASRPAHGERPPVSWPVMSIGAAAAGIGFTVSLLIAGLAFSGRTLAEAKLAVIASVVLATAVAFVLRQVVKRLPAQVRARQLAGTAEELLDLSEDVEPDRDHVRGPDHAIVTLVEYGDFECPYCGQAETTVRELLSEFGGELRYVWRHLPLADVHPSAQLAAEAAEAAAEQGRFWEFYERLLAHEGIIGTGDLQRIGSELGLEMDRFWEQLRRHEHAERIADDVASADASGVTGTPTFFINRRRHQGAYDLETLTQAVRAAGRRARLLASASVADTAVTAGERQ
jgi:Na+/H+ antiporter NhaA